MDDIMLTVEESYISALLARPELASELPALRVTDFTDPYCQAIYRAIVDAHAARPAAAGDRDWLLEHVASTVQDARVSRQDLVLLADMGFMTVPLAASFARIITEAAIHHDLASHADRIAEGGNTTLAAHLIAATAAAPTITQAAQDAPQLSREQEARELTVLAGLIRHPEDISEVTSWLPADAFTDGIRREIYQTITTLNQAGDPVDSHTVISALAASRDPGGYGTAVWDDISLYIQLNLDPQAPERADTITAARDLLTAQINADLSQQPQPAPAPGAQPATPGLDPRLQPPSALPRSEPLPEL